MTLWAATMRCALCRVSCGSPSALAIHLTHSHLAAATVAVKPGHVDCTAALPPPPPPSDESAVDAMLQATMDDDGSSTLVTWRDIAPAAARLAAHAAAARKAGRRVARA